MKMLKAMLVLFSITAAPGALLAAQPVVNVEPPNLHGPRPLQDQTATGGGSRLSGILAEPECCTAAESG